MKIILAATSVAALLIATPAGARMQLRTQDGTTPQPYAAWADRSQMPAPPVSVTIVPLSWCHDDQWTIACAGYIDPANRVYKIGVISMNMPRWDFMHEVGHIFDFSVMDTEGRDEFRALALPLRGGWDGTQHDWLDHSAFALPEQFADAYAWCSTGVPRRAPRQWFHGWNPSTGRHRHACGVIQRAYARHLARVKGTPS